MTRIDYFVLTQLQKAKIQEREIQLKKNAEIKRMRNNSKSVDGNIKRKINQLFIKRILIFPRLKNKKKTIHREITTSI